MNDYVGKLLVDAKMGDLAREARGGQMMRAGRSGADRRGAGKAARLVSGLWGMVAALLVALHISPR